MSIAEIIEQSVDQKLIEFSKSDAAIAVMAEQFLPMKLESATDKKGFEIIRTARIQVKTTRVDIEKKRVELKADALAFGRKVDGEAKRLTAMVDPIESHLEAQEKIFTDERDRVKREADAAKERHLQARIDALDVIGATFSPMTVRAMTDEHFATFLSRETERIAAAKAEAETKRLAEEQAKQIESEQLAKERAELAEQRRLQEIENHAIEERREKIRQAEEAERAKLKAESDRLAELQRKIDAEQAEAKRLADIEVARKEAAERAEREAKERLEREAAEKAERIRLETIAMQHAEYMKPDSDKILDMADRIAMVVTTQLSNAVSAKTNTRIRNVIKKACADLQAIAAQVLQVESEES